MNDFTNPKKVQEVDDVNGPHDMVAGRFCIMCKHYGEHSEGICAECLPCDRSNWKPSFEPITHRSIK